MLQKPKKYTSPAQLTGYSRSEVGGFTLIELMIVTLIIAILAAIAVPAYQDYVLRSNRAVGKHTLFDIASRQEQFFTDNKQYADSLADLGYSSASPYYIDNQGAYEATSSEQIYQVTLGNTGGTTTYTAEIQALQRQLKDGSCDELSLTHLNVKAAEDAGGTDSTSDCW